MCLVWWKNNDPFVLIYQNWPKLTAGRDNRIRKETKENRENSEAAQRERYYATIHKVAHQAGEKIPETSEDISPYATFQLSEASTLAQPANTLLHSFMYHERALQEGCASPPPAVLSQHNTKSSHYYNIVRLISFTPIRNFVIFF